MFEVIFLTIIFLILIILGSSSKVRLMILFFLLLFVSPVYSEEPLSELEILRTYVQDIKADRDRKEVTVAELKAIIKRLEDANKKKESTDVTPVP